MRNFIALALAVCLGGLIIHAQQDGNSVTLSRMPQNKKVTTNTEDDGAGTLLYSAWAYSDQTAAWAPSIANAGLTSIVDSANTSTVTTVANHGLLVGNRIYIGGATDTDLNGYYYVQTTPTATTFTVTTASVTDATYNGAALYMSTRAPRTNTAVWYITKQSSSGNVDYFQNSTEPAAWDSRATTTGASMVTYQ